MIDPRHDWILYGPTGVTGRMVLAEALARGHRPVLAGRDAAKLASLAAPHGLMTQAVALDNASAMAALTKERRLILNAAGPFEITGKPVLDAAIAGRCSYLDLNGELDFLLAALGRDEQARSASMAGVVAVGFGVAAGDCIVAHVARRIDKPVRLRLAIAPASAHASPAVAASTVAALRYGGRRVIGGEIAARAIGDRRWTEISPDGSKVPFASAPLAELGAAWASTGIADIVAGTPMPALTALAVRTFSPVMRAALSVPAIQRMASRMSGHAATDGPADQKRMVSHVWATVENAAGDVATSRLDAGEGYAFAALSAIRAVERMIAGRVHGGISTPAQAFGPEFLTAMPGNTLVDLPVYRVKAGR